MRVPVILALTILLTSGAAIPAAGAGAVKRPATTKKRPAGGAHVRQPVSKIAKRGSAVREAAPGRKRLRRRGRRARVRPPSFHPYELANWPVAAVQAGMPSLQQFPPPPDLPRNCTLCGTQLLSTAYSLVGTRYRPGGTRPETGFDCSGFVRYVYEMNFPVSLPPSAPLQFRTGQPVYRGELDPGDLVFFRTRRGWHVGMYVGGDSFIHAPNRRKTVTVSPLFSDAYWNRAFVGARRIALPGLNAADVLSASN